MLYRVLISLLLLATITFTSCYDGDGFHKDPEPGFITIYGPNQMEFEICGEDFVDSELYEIHVADSEGTALQDVLVRVALDQYLEFMDQSDSASYTDENGDVLVEIGSEYFGDGFWFKVEAAGDTEVFEIEISTYDEPHIFCIDTESDSLLFHDSVLDSIAVIVNFRSSFGAPMIGRPLWLQSTKGFIDTSMRIIDSMPDTAYWYSTEPEQLDDVMVHATSSWECGSPHNFVELFITDTTSFILAPAP